MQTGRIQRQQQTRPIHEADIQEEVSSLGLRLISRAMEFDEPGITTEDLTTVTSPRKRQSLCDRMQETWPPTETEGALLVPLQIGQIGLLFSQNRVLDPQRLIDFLIELDKTGELYTKTFISCFLLYGIRVSLPVDQWEALGSGTLSNAGRKWAQVIFFPEGQDETHGYMKCCYQLIKQIRNGCLYRETLLELIKYWVIQGMPSQHVLEIVIFSVDAASYDCLWDKLFSTFYHTDSVWQVLRDRDPGHFDDINILMANKLPDGRSFFLALWQAFKGKCDSSCVQLGLFSHLESLGVNLNVEVSPGRDLLDELAEQYPLKSAEPDKPPLFKQLFRRLGREGSAMNITPLILARTTRAMDAHQCLALLYELLNDKDSGIHWSHLFNVSGELCPEWRKVMPEGIKISGDLLAQRHSDGTFFFMSFLEQSRSEALHWLLDLSGGAIAARAGNDFFEPLVQKMLEDGDSTGMHVLASFLESESPETRQKVLSHVCRRNMFNIILAAVKNQPGGEHIIGGSMRVLRVLATRNRACLQEVAELSKIAWQNFFGGNIPVPSHLASITLGREWDFQEELTDLQSYFPERVSRFSFVEGVGNIESGLWGAISSHSLVKQPDISCQLRHVGGSRIVPENSVLLLSCHGNSGVMDGYNAENLAGRLGEMLKTYSKTLPDRMVLEACLGARSKGGKSLSSAEQFARSWYRQTRKRVSVLAYEGLVTGSLFHPLRKVEHQVTDAYGFRGRRPRESLVTVSSSGRMKKTWRYLHFKQHFPRRLQFS